MMLYHVYLVEPDEIECTVPAVRNVKAFYGMEDMQFVASNPPELPAYAGYEVLHHHGNMVSMGSKIPMVMKCSLILTLYKASKTETLDLCQRKPFSAMRQGGILF